MRTDDLVQPGDVALPSATSRRIGDAVLNLLHDLGFEVCDFVIEDEPHSALARELGLLGGLLRVQCRSTNEDRLYSSGRGSTWMAAILSDLDDGHFARARRSDATSGAAHRGNAAARERQQHAHDDFADTSPDVRLASNPDAATNSRWGQVVPFRPRTFSMQPGLGGF